LGIERIIEIAVALTILASAMDQLPKVIREVQIAEVRLLEQSKTKTWGKLLIVKNRGTQ
jgi:hypothetical protein